MRGVQSCGKEHEERTHHADRLSESSSPPLVHPVMPWDLLPPHLVAKMKRGAKACFGKRRQVRKEKRRCMQNGRRRTCRSCTTVGPRLLKGVLIVWLLPSVSSFSSPKVVPVDSTKCSVVDTETSTKAHSRTCTSRSATVYVDHTLEEDIEELHFGSKIEHPEFIGASINITSIEEGVVVADYPDCDGVPQKNGTPDKNGVADKNGATKANGVIQKADVSQKDGKKESRSVRDFWKRRHARSIQEGIRRETTTQLSSLLEKAKTFASGQGTSNLPSKRRYVARSISGLIHALAEEADGLEVEVDTRKNSPLWSKQVDAVRIQFSRLSFKPLRISGLDRALRKLETLSTDEKGGALELAAVCCPDEAFDKIDADESGALDADEIAVALNVAAATDSDKDILEGLASELVEIYDANGDGVVDRGEYQSMVEDMAELRREQKERAQEEEKKERLKQERERLKQERSGGWRGTMKNAMRTVFKDDGGDEESLNLENLVDAVENEGEELPEDAELMDSVTKGEGSIVFSGLKLDLRRLFFGGIPLVKKITPGGPLVLEPFTMTMTGSFNADDVMESGLLDAGLRRLVLRVIRRRIVFQLRDLVDGALFYGRAWRMTSEAAPNVEIPKLEHVEFDKQDRMIITGRALVRTSPDSPSVEQAFKVRCKIGTRANGRYIRLVEPELALVLECPKAWERNIVGACKKLQIPVPTRPEPLYSFFPLYSPFKMGDNDGFDLGEDNRIKSIYIKDGALRFELSAVLRPGRFLDNHYLAFTVPNRTFIITMDRVREGIRAARKNKKEVKEAQRKIKEAERKLAVNAYRDALSRSISSDHTLLTDLKFKDPPIKNGVSLAKKNIVRPHTKSFFSRFVEGYLGSKETKEEEHELRTERLTAAISDWFGRQGTSDDNDSLE